MVDQERCGVIVMLTNLQEGGREKCARYWMPGADSKWSIESMFKDGSIEKDESAAAANPGDYFATAKTDTAAKSEDPLIRRTIRTKRRSSPSDSKPRTVRHMHYRAWPDFDLPASPDDIVRLVREVDAAQRAYMQEIGWNDTDREPPIVAHCSAGVGRTGVFIMVSTLLDKLRRERRRSRAEADGDEPMREERTRSISSLSSSSSHTATSDTASLTAGFEAQSLRSQTASPAPGLLGPDSHNDARDGTTEAERDADKALELDGGDSSRGSTVPLDKDEPIFAAANEMRESRMSMIANYRQYVCVHECVLLGTLQDMDDFAMDDGR